ncbi:CMP-N-acetylneuraminate-beta-galactosamide-alpha-2,3-sialyltransferase 4 isoform X3 [Syngnathoides biaculeatus]|uniref:CMP-N-acetylneuraminate-beta-galactosamide- alpha-2,3-sialyltransferase 4 isoform X3 n=1 Tax=Syngnathoides biaculeatus TaxID=300417 RepID=UPI002ADE31D0|nr:CMP-N-acetylneuraminate-beta-galactosamide-alpha-2,3-sialyltransferase 4 isoform X3 [Syngnathoides biaculeatus]
MTERKAWCLRLLPVLFFFISFVTYYCSYAILQSYAGTSKSVNSSKSLCGGWLTQKKWESLNFNITRQMQLFLKLDDFFWREHLSTLGLPYGIKGSELQLLKVLAVTANYQVPANIDNLECRTCVVIGNGFAIKNTSLGGIINKYDVVIRLNDAPVRGYEDDVGNKTTMRFFYPESASYNPGLNNEPDTLMVLVPFKQQDLRWLKEILYNEKRVRKGFWKPPPQIWLGDVAQIRVLDPYFLQQTAEKLLQIPLNPKSKQEKACHIFETLKKQKGNEAKKEELTASNVCFERVGACGNLQNVKVQAGASDHGNPRRLRGPQLLRRRPPRWFRVPELSEHQAPDPLLWLRHDEINEEFLP